MIKISYNIISRNDSYYIDNNDILSQTINTNLFFLDKINKKDKVEFNIIDWGSKNQLYKNIRIFEEYEKNVNFFYVDKKTADSLSESYPNKFNLNVPPNLAVRYSKGEFIIQGTSDQILSRIGWFNLINIIENDKKFNFDFNNTIFYVPRKKLELNFYKKKPSMEILEYFLNYHNSSYMYSKNSNFFQGGGYSLFCSKKIIEKMGGINNEKNNPNSGNDADLNIRFTRLGFKQIDTNSFGVHFYKFPSDKNSIRNKLLKSDLTRQPPPFSIDNFPNGESWGMKDYKIQINQPQNLFKNFDINIDDNFSLDKFNLKLSTQISILSKFHHIKFDIKEWKLIFQIIKIIKSNRIFSIVEIGFDNVNRFSAIGQEDKSIEILSIDLNCDLSKYYYVDRLMKVQQILSRKRYGKFTALNSKFFKDLNDNINQMKIDKWSSLFLVNILSIQSKKTLEDVENQIMRKIDNISYVIFSDKSEKFNCTPHIEQGFKKIYNGSDLQIYINKDIFLKNKNSNLDIFKLSNLNIINLFLIYSLYSIYDFLVSSLKKINKKIFSFKY